MSEEGAGTRYKGKNSWRKLCVCGSNDGQQEQKEKDGWEKVLVGEPVWENLGWVVSQFGTKSRAVFEVLLKVHLR